MNNMLFKPNTKATEIVKISDIYNLWLCEKDGIPNILVKLYGGHETWFKYDNIDERKADWDRLISLMQTSKKENLNMENDKHNFLTTTIKDMKGFISEHKNVIYTVLVIFLVDHFIFEGSFRERLKSIVNGLINKVEKKLEGQ